MPKPNRSMLDQLSQTFKSMGKRKPEIIRQGEFNPDPLIKDEIKRRFAAFDDDRYGLVKDYADILGKGRIPRDLTPERVKYQKGLDNIRATREQPYLFDQGQAEMSNEELQNDFESAWDEAWDAYMDAAQGEPSQFVPAPELEYGLLDSDFIFEPDSRNLKDYWPSGYYSPAEFEAEREYFDDKWSKAQDAIDYMSTPEYRMELQRQSPRYRNYQRAMRQREDNARVGHLNAAIMNLYRRGYSMPEIREILRRQGR